MKFAIPVLILVVVVAVVTLLRIRRSAEWKSVEGVISSSTIDDVYNRPGDLATEGMQPVEYEFAVEYRYEFRGQRRTGSQLTPGVPAIFRQRGRAEELLERFPVGAKVPVYVNPDDPSQTALITGADIGSRGWFVIIAMVVVVFTVIAVGAYVVSSASDSAPFGDDVETIR